MLLLLLLTFSKQRIDPDRVIEAYTKKGALVLRRCRILLREEAAAEDAFQEVFIRLMRYGGNMTSEEVPLSWLYRTAERCCFDRMKKGRQEVQTDPEMLTEMVGVQGAETSMETFDLVLRYLHTLNDELKQVAVLHYVDGLSQEQIADELDRSRRTIGKRLKQLKKHAELIKKRTEAE